MKNLTKLEKSWILYDVGNSAFVLLTATLLPIYFNYLADLKEISSANYLAYWGYATSVVTIIVAFIGPILGTVADYRGMKKPLFTIFVLLGAIGCLFMGITKSWWIFLLIFIFSKIGYSSSLIFYDAMIHDVTSHEKMDTISSQGYAWGYIGSCIPFIIALAIVLAQQQGILPLSLPIAMLIAFSIVAIWWLCFTLPIWRNYHQIHFIEKQDQIVKNTFKRLGKTLRHLSLDRKVFWFLLAYFFYIDGVYTIIDMATAYGTALGLDSTGLLLALLLMQIVAFPSALTFGYLTKKFKSENLIMTCIIAYTLIVIYAIFLKTQFQFWVLAVCVGMFQGGIQALSRSYFAKIIPAEKSGEFFGLLDICGKGASFLGTTLVSVISQITGKENYGIGVMAIVFIIGLLFFQLSLSCSKKQA